MTKTIWPCFIVTTYSCVEVTQYDQRFLLLVAFDGGFKLVVEDILDIIRGCESWSINAQLVLVDPSDVFERKESRLSF